MIQNRFALYFLNFFLLQEDIHKVHINGNAGEKGVLTNTKVILAYGCPMGRRPKCCFYGGSSCERQWEGLCILL